MYFKKKTQQIKNGTKYLSCLRRDLLTDEYDIFTKMFVLVYAKIKSKIRTNRNWIQKKKYSINKCIIVL